MIYIISKYDRELEILRLAVEKRSKEYELKKIVGYEQMDAMQDGDVIIGKLPLNLLFAIKADIEMYVPYPTREKKVNYYHYLLQQVMVDDKSCTAYILLGAVDRLGF